MASRQTTVDYILEQTKAAGSVSARKMFGEYGVYCDGRMVALICDDQLFVKPTVGGRALAAVAAEAPPYPGAKPHLLISADYWDDADWMAELIRASTAELPVPASKRPNRASAQKEKDA